MSPFFQKLPGRSIEINSKDARTALEVTKLDENELVVSLDHERLHTNVPVDEPIEIAFRELYSSDKVPLIPRSAMKSFLRLAIPNVHFNFNNMW